MIRAPLFPGYLFVRSRMTAHDHVEILKTKGAVYVIGGSHGPLHIPDETIESLKIISGTEKVVTGNQFRHGDSVVVMAGPFEGVYGIFTRYKGTDRVVVHIEALGQFAAVEIDVNDVEAVNPALSCDTKREAVAAGLALG